MSKLFKNPCGAFTGDEKPTGKKIWRNMSGSNMHMWRKQKIEKLMMRKVATSRTQH